MSPARARMSHSSGKPSKAGQSELTPLRDSGYKLVYDASSEEATRPDIVPAWAHFAEESSGSVPAVERFRATAHAAYAGWPALRLAYQRTWTGPERAVLVHPLKGALAQSLRDRSSRALNELFERRLRHALVMPVVDLVSLRGETLLVMEYAPGVTLGTLVREGGPLSPAIALAVACDVLRALHAGHTAVSQRGDSFRLAHGSLNPDEILIGMDGRAKILDFGLAENEPESRTGSYAAPEQTFEGRPDARTDVFLAGILLWECLTGYALLSGSSPVERLMKFMTEGCDPPSRFNREVPPALDAAIARALDPSPERRFQSAAEFASALSGTLRPAPAAAVAGHVRCSAADCLEHQEAWRRGASEAPPASSTRNVKVSRDPERRPAPLPEPRAYPNPPRATPLPAETAPVDAPRSVREEVQSPRVRPVSTPAPVARRRSTARLPFVLALSSVAAIAFVVSASSFSPLSSPLDFPSEPSAPPGDGFHSKGAPPGDTAPPPRLPSRVVTAVPSSPPPSTDPSDVPVVSVDDLPVSKPNEGATKSKRGTVARRGLPQRGTRTTK